MRHGFCVQASHKGIVGYETVCTLEHFHVDLSTWDLNLTVESKIKVAEPKQWV